MIGLLKSSFSVLHNSTFFQTRSKNRFSLDYCIHASEIQTLRPDAHRYVNLITHPDFLLL